MSRGVSGYPNGLVHGYNKAKYKHKSSREIVIVTNMQIHLMRLIYVKVIIAKRTIHPPYLA